MKIKTVKKLIAVLLVTAAVFGLGAFWIHALVDDLSSKTGGAVAATVAVLVLSAVGLSEYVTGVEFKERCRKEDEEYDKRFGGGSDA